MSQKSWLVTPAIMNISATITLLTIYHNVPHYAHHVWALLLFYIVKHHLVAWKFSLKIVLHGFLPFVGFLSGWTRNRKQKFLADNFLVTDKRSLYYSSASRSLKRPGAQVCDVIYNYVTRKKVDLTERGYISSCTGVCQVRITSKLHTAI